MITDNLLTYSLQDFSYDNAQLSIASYLATDGEQTTSEQDLGAESIYTRNGRVEALCRKRSIRRFFRSSPHVLQKRVYYNTTGVCTCSVPKAASTSIGRLMLMAEFPEMSEYYRTLPGNMIHTTKRVEYLNTEKCSGKPGISFFVTRDPYARLYSAYVDKVFLEKFGQLAVLIDAIYNKKVTYGGALKINTLTQIAKDKNWMCDVSNVTFEQFLYYVSRTRHLDPHYTPVSLLCNPCKDPVDYIFKQENLEEDADYLLDYLNKTLAENGVKHSDLTLKDYKGDNGVENLVKTHYVAWKVRSENNNCVMSSASLDMAYRRLWEAMKILGNIDDSLNYIPEIFHGSGNNFKDPDEILKAFVQHNIEPASPAQRARQRRKYLVDAYKTVSPRVLKGIQNLFQMDFKFFKYDINPPT